MKNVDARFPIGRLSVITGISGSGKSTLMRSVLLPAVQQALRTGQRAAAQCAPISARTHRGDLRSRSIADRKNLALDARDLHQGLRRNSQPFRAAAGLAGARLHREPLFLQHRRRTLRNVRRTGRAQAGDEFSPEQLRAVRRLRRTTLQSADPRSALSRAKHRRRDEHDDRAGRGIFCRQPKDRAPAWITRRNRPRLSQARPAEPDLERRRGATTQARDEIDPWSFARAKRAPAQNADPEIDPLSPGGADHRLAHGGRGIASQGPPSTGR